GNYTDAIKYFKKCLPVAKTANNSLGISMNLNNIGEAYENMNLIDSAIYYYNESLKYSKKINREKGIAICYNALGNAYQKQKRYEEA
ncbi:tetratricopeptide repeat protein, partial [Bacillus cereus group sp. Bce026]|uniref:tetratricopeptide repeat protein n=1 Tax=Bacillus cereus group sp. Bce026 TaxID=3445242 RepID=UPI003F29E7AC